MVQKSDNLFSNYADIFEDGASVGTCWYLNEDADTVLKDKISAVRSELGQPREVSDEGVLTSHTLCIYAYDSGETSVVDEYGAYDTAARELIDYQRYELPQTAAVQDLAQASRLEIDRLESEASREKVDTQGVMDDAGIETDYSIYNEDIPF